jgi:hypothetical protein
MQEARTRPLSVSLPCLPSSLSLPRRPKIESLPLVPCNLSFLVVPLINLGHGRAVLVWFREIIVA